MIRMRPLVAWLVLATMVVLGIVWNPFWFFAAGFVVLNNSPAIYKGLQGRLIALRHGAFRCVATGHRWDIAAHGPSGSAFNCLRPGCKLVHDSHDGYVWDP